MINEFISSKFQVLFLLQRIPPVGHNYQKNLHPVEEAQRFSKAPSFDDADNDVAITPTAKGQLLLSV